MPRRKTRRRFLAATGSSVVFTGCLRLDESEPEGATAGETEIESTASRTRSVTPSATSTATTAEASTDTQDPTETQSATETRTQAEPDYPIGMSRNGVSGTLAEGNENALAQQESYTVDIGKNEVGKYENSVTHAMEGSDLALQSGRRGSEQRSFDRYYEDDLVLGRVQQADGYLFTEITTPWGFPLNWLLRTKILQSQFKAGEFSEPAATSVEGEEVFRSTSSGVSDPEPILNQWSWFNGDSIGDFSASVLVRPDNTIKRYTSSTTLVGESVLTIEFDYETSGFGSSPVSEPGWTADARNRAPKFETTHRSDGHLTVEHVGGQSIPGEAAVSLSAAEGDYSGRQSLDENLSEGDGLWIWREGSSMKWSFEQPTDSNPDPLHPDDVIRVRLFPVVIFLKKVSEF